MRKKILGLKENVKNVIVGKEEVLDLILTALLSGGHILLEDMPGTGKTLLAKSLAVSMGGTFRRIQFTPDLLPSDVTGLHYFDQKEGEFRFREGPVFTQILLADEINRATPRTQSSLLECMEERQVTVDGRTSRLDELFFVMATQNPVESAGTYPLPEAQMDRFFMKTVMTYPSGEEERQILDLLAQRGYDTPHMSGSKLTIDDVQFLRTAARRVHVSEKIEQYVVDLVSTTRGSGPRPIDGLAQLVRLGASPRASIALVRIGQAFALMNGRDFVIPEDIKIFAHEVLRHRILLTFEALADNVTSDEIVDRVVQVVPIP